MVMYEAETWSMRIQDQTKINVMENKYLRSLCGVSKID